MEKQKEMGDSEEDLAERTTPVKNSILPPALFATLQQLLADAAAFHHGTDTTQEAWVSHWGNVQMTVMFMEHIRQEFVARHKPLEKLRRNLRKIFSIAGHKPESGSLIPRCLLLAQAVVAIVRSNAFSAQELTTEFVPKVVDAIPDVVRSDDPACEVLDTDGAVLLIRSVHQLFLESAENRSRMSSVPPRAAQKMYSVLLAGMRTSDARLRGGCLDVLHELSASHSAGLPDLTTKMIEKLQLIEQNGHLPMEERNVTQAVSAICVAAQQRSLLAGDREVILHHAMGLFSVP